MIDIDTKILTAVLGAAAKRVGIAATRQVLLSANEELGRGENTLDLALDRITAKSCLAVTTALKEEFTLIEKSLKGVNSILDGKVPAAKGE